MDVTCDRCKAEYEFDEALLGERGTTVKCSACGHVFRVLPPSRDAVRSQLQLRLHGDGSVRALGSLRELQQLIRAGEVTLDDELGRPGFPFRPLRDVPELKNFFLSQKSRHEQSTVRADSPYPQDDDDEGNERTGAWESPLKSSPPEPEETGLENFHSDPPEPSTNPPRPAPESEEDEWRRRAASVQAAYPVAPERSPAGRTIPAPAGAPPDTGPRGARGTMSYVQQGLPPPPRLPDFHPQPPRAEPVAPPAAAPSPRPAPQPRFGSGTVAGLPGMDPHLAPHTAPPTPSPDVSHGMKPGSTHPMATRSSDRALSSSVLRGDAQPNVERGASDTFQDPIPAHAARGDEPTSARPLVEPDRFPQFKTLPSPIPPGPGKAGPRKLYLDADEHRPKRDAGGSRGWLYVALLMLALGGGGWFGMTRMRVSGKATVDPKPTFDKTPPVAAEPSAPAAEAPTASVPAHAAPPLKAEPAAKPAPGPAGAAPFAPPVPELQAELARRSGEQPEPSKAGKPIAKPTPAPKLAPAAPAPAKPPVQATTPKPAPAPVVAKPVVPKTVFGAAPAVRPAPASSNDYGAQLNYADSLYAKGEIEPAIEAYKKALSVRASGSEANSGLGFALLKQGKASEALPYFDRAASSGYAEANIGLGDAYRSLGQPSAAKESYQAYLERLPTGARASYARTWLDKLSGGGVSKPAERSAEPDSYRPAGELAQPSE